MTRSIPMPFRAFLDAFGRLLARAPGEGTILNEGAALLRRLVAVDGWLPDAFARPSAQGYRQYLIHLDPAGRFSVVSFVWAPGQATPIHDHGTWGLVGVLRGGELDRRFVRAQDGRLIPAGAPALLGPGRVVGLSDDAGDLHQVANALTDAPSVTIHVYGGDIGHIRRNAYREDGTSSPFVSGYTPANAPPDWPGHVPADRVAGAA